MEQSKEGIALVEATVAHCLAGCSCSESIAYAFGSQAGCDPLLAFRASSGFAGGMGLGGETCGAVAAAMMLLGCRFGPKSLNDMEGRRLAKDLASEFADRIIEERGSTLCAELRMGHPLSSPEGRQTLLEICLPLIRCTATTLSDMLTEYSERC